MKHQLLAKVGNEIMMNPNHVYVVALLQNEDLYHMHVHAPNNV